MANQFSIRADDTNKNEYHIFRPKNNRFSLGTVHEPSEVVVYEDKEMAKDILNYMNKPTVTITKTTANKIGRMIEMLADFGGSSNREEVVRIAIDEMYEKLKSASEE